MIKRNRLEMVADQAKQAVLALKACKCSCCKALLRKSYKALSRLTIGKV